MSALVPVASFWRNVKLVGLGGVGGVLARYLFLFQSSQEDPGRTVFIDGDEFEPKNAERMLFSRRGNKATVVMEDLLEAAPDSGVALDAVEEYVTLENAGRLFRPGDLIFLAVDNHATRKLVGEFCDRELVDFCLISGGNDGVGPDSSGSELRGTYGNVQIHLRRDGRDLTPPLTRFHPEIAEPADQPPAELSCLAAYASVPQLLFTNLATASAMLNAFFLVACDALHYPELGFDVFDGVMRPVPLPCEVTSKVR